jgi:hypothetical protein
MHAVRTACLIALAAGLLTAPVGAVRAQSSSAPAAPAGPPTDFDAIEEDWELVVATPDPVGVGPQITTCMSPIAGDPSPFFVAFDLNYRERPNFLPGGMQVQVWANGQILSTSSGGSALFATRRETVTWTQRMWLTEGLVVYDINNGSSTTWGAFGQGGQLSTVFPGSVTSLLGYDPDASVRTSGVGWESNNVAHLTLVRVRYYSGGQLLWTDTNSRPVVANDNP